jgi:hypothetical protein
LSLGRYLGLHGKTILPHVPKFRRLHFPSLLTRSSTTGEVAHPWTQ